MEQELIKKSVREALKELKANLSVIPSPEKNKELEGLLLREAEKIEQFLSSGKEEKRREFLLPYPLIQKLIETVKVKIFERLALKGEATGREVESLNDRFNRLEREIAENYLIRDVAELRDIKNSKFKKYALYRAHSRFVERIIEAVQKRELSLFPLESYSKSDFRKSIYYPESIMACMNAYFCDYLENLERSVFRAAKAFYVLLQKGNYSEAYLAFRELKELALKVSQKLAELYFLAFTNGESNFIKLLDYIGNLYPERFVAALDFADLKNLNRVLSEAGVNSLLEKVERTIHNHFREKVEKYLAVRGINHNFLILGVRVDGAEFEREMEELYGKVRKDLEEEGVVAQFRIYGFLMTPSFEGFENRLNNFLARVKEKAKKEERRVKLIYSEEGVKELLSWQKEQLQKINFIRQKVDGEEVEVVFQPIAEGGSFRTIALETLFRIKDGTGLIPAGLFIDVIYQLNLITRIDRLVLERIVNKKELIGAVTERLFINVSPQSLANRSFLKELDRFVNSMKDFLVIVEITEQRLLENACELKNLSRKYPNLKFAIDDFGSGYSSFKLVIDLAENRTLEVLKLDGSYTRKVSTSPFTRKAIRAISSLSKSLGIKTVAEFVEEKKTAEILKEEGIDFIQGFLISKPKTIEELIYQFEQVNSL